MKKEKVLLYNRVTKQKGLGSIPGPPPIRYEAKRRTVLGSWTQSRAQACETRSLFPWPSNRINGAE